MYDMDDVIDEACDAYERLYNDVKKHIKTKGYFSISDIQRTFKLGYYKTAQIKKDLEREGFVKKGDGIHIQHCVDKTK